jgi:23S rRNA (guanosine2251-2'-O)-methyltransferase
MNKRAKKDSRFGKDPRAKRDSGRKEPRSEGERRPSSTRDRGAKGARDESASLIYGRRPITEILRHAPERIEKLLIAGRAFSQAGSSDGAAPDGGELKSILELAKKSGIVGTAVDRQALDDLTSGGVHQGVAAHLSAAPAFSLEKLAAMAKEQNGIIVAIDQVTDPHNFGAVLRAADGAGASGAIVPKSGSSPVTAVVRKSSAGAADVLPLCQVSNLGQALERLKKEGFWVIGTALSETSTDLYQAELALPAVVVIGSEGKGIRRLTAELCDFLIEIPMSGALQSLNVSQAAAVVLF